jgi:hypothetical protein
MTVKNVDVLVLCGGKCGSSTLAKTFVKNGYKCIKIHNEEDYFLQFKSRKLYETIELSSKNKKLYIIDCYRTPIERKISSFFENISKHAPNHNNMPNKELMKIFNEKQINYIEDYHSINDALNKYNIPRWTTFDFEKKYNITKKGNIVFIKLLFKDIQQWDKILTKILGKKIIMFNDNLTNTKPEYKKYQRFKEMYKPPIDYINNIIKNDFEFKTYNTKEEQEQYIQKWLDIANGK